MDKYNSDEFYNIIKNYYEHDEVQKMNYYKHHGITRLDHSLRVSYFTYKVTKLLRLNYRDATIAAMLHDFFLDDVKDENGLFKLRRHADCAVYNSKKYFNINPFQEDIIKRHMFPVTFTPPKYLEGWIVDIVDDFSAIYERGYDIGSKAKASISIIIIMIIGLIR